MTFWLAFMADRFASASTGWAMSLDETDITTLLPSPTNLYPDVDLAASPLSPRNANFLISHPPHLVQGFQLHMKAVVLLGRIVTFLQRSPTPTAWKVGAPDEREAPFDLRTTREFKQLDADAVTFRLSIPREYQNILQWANEDNRLCLVFALPHTTTILLHEPFCTMQEGDVSMARCLLSARAILEAIYSLWSSSFEIGHLSPFINVSRAVLGSPSQRADPRLLSSFAGPSPDVSRHLWLSTSIHLADPPAPQVHWCGSSRSNRPRTLSPAPSSFVRTSTRF